MKWTTVIGYVIGQILSLITNVHDNRSVNWQLKIQYNWNKQSSNRVRNTV